MVISHYPSAASKGVCTKMKIIIEKRDFSAQEIEDFNHPGVVARVNKAATKNASEDGNGT